MGVGPLDLVYLRCCRCGGVGSTTTPGRTGIFSLPSGGGAGAEEDPDAPVIVTVFAVGNLSPGGSGRYITLKVGREALEAARVIREKLYGRQNFHYEIRWEISGKLIEEA